MAEDSGSPDDDDDPFNSSAFTQPRADCSAASTIPPASIPTPPGDFALSEIQQHVVLAGSC